jgi:hypothetical protein
MIGRPGIENWSKKNLRKSAWESAKICGKYFSTLNSFRVQESFPADLRRFFRRSSQITTHTKLSNQFLQSGGSLRDQRYF